MSKKSGKVMVRKAAGAQGRREVTSEEAFEFIREMQKAFPRNRRGQGRRKERLRKYLAQFRDELLKAVGRRVQSDVMLRPPVTVRRRDILKSRPSRTLAR